MLFKRILTSLLLLCLVISCKKRSYEPDTTITPHQTSVSFLNEYSGEYDVANSVTFKVKLSSSNPYDNQLIEGIVYFYDDLVSNKNAICASEIVNGIAECQISSFLESGVHLIRAVYAGNKYYEVSQSTIQYNTLTKETSLELNYSVQGNAVHAYDYITFVATLKYTKVDDLHNINGKIEFFDNEQILSCDEYPLPKPNPSVESPIVSCTTRFYQGGDHDGIKHIITAKFGKDSIYRDSNKSIDVFVQKRETQPNPPILSASGIAGSPPPRLGSKVCVNINFPVEYYKKNDGTIIGEIPMPQYYIETTVLGRIIKGQFKLVGTGESKHYNYEGCSAIDLSKQPKQTYKINFDTPDTVYRLPDNITETEISTNEKYQPTLSIASNPIILPGSEIKLIATLSNLAVDPSNENEFISPGQNNVNFYFNNNLVKECENKTIINIQKVGNSFAGTVDCAIQNMKPGTYSYQAKYIESESYNEASSKVETVNVKKIIPDVSITQIDGYKLKVVLTTNHSFTDIPLSNIGHVQIYLNDVQSDILPILGCETQNSNSRSLDIVCTSVLGGTKLNFTALFTPYEQYKAEYDAVRSNQQNLTFPIRINYGKDCNVFNGCQFKFFYDKPISNNTTMVVSKVSTSEAHRALLQPKSESQLLTNHISHRFICGSVYNSPKIIQCDQFAPFSDKFTIDFDSENKLLPIHLEDIEIDTTTLPVASDDRVTTCGRLGYNELSTQQNYTTLQRMYDCSKRVKNFAGRGNGGPNGNIDLFVPGDEFSINRSWFLVSCEDENKAFCTWLSPVIPNKLIRNDLRTSTIDSKTGKSIEELVNTEHKNRVLWSARSKEGYNFFRANGGYARTYYAAIAPYIGRYIKVYDTYFLDSDPSYNRIIPTLELSKICVPNFDDCELVQMRINDAYGSLWSGVRYYNKTVCDQTADVQMDGLLKGQNYNWQMPSYPFILMLTGGTIMPPQDSLCEPGGYEYENNGARVCLSIKNDNIVDLNKDYAGFRAASIVPAFVDHLWSSSTATTNSAWAYANYNGVATPGHPYHWEPYVRCMSMEW